MKAISRCYCCCCRLLLFSLVFIDAFPNYPSYRLGRTSVVPGGNRHSFHLPPNPAVKREEEGNEESSALDNVENYIWEDEDERFVLRDEHGNNEESDTSLVASIPTLNSSISWDTFSADMEQALSSQVSYFYLQKGLNLSEETLWKFTHDAPSVLGMTAKTIRNKVETLQCAMNLSPEDIRTILHRQPSVLQLSAAKNIAPTLKWIQSALQLSTDELRQLIVAQPTLLTYSVSANLRHKLKFFTHQHKGLGFSIPQCRQLLLKEPRLWTAGVQHGLAPRARFFLVELELSKEQLREAVLKNPLILLYSLENNLAPKLINYAIMTLHMDPKKDVAKLVTSYPQFLDYNLDRHVLPLTRYFLTEEVQLSAHEFRSIVLKYPRVITHSLAKVKHTVGFLRYQLGLDADGVRRVIYQAPQVLGLNTERNLIPKVEFLQQELLGYTLFEGIADDGEGTAEVQGDGADAAAEKNERDMQVIRKVILGMPTVLNLSVEKNLAPKMEYLRSMLQREVRTTDDGTKFNNPLQQQLQETLLRMPALLGYSLEKRIKPRMRKIVDAGLPPSRITMGITRTQADFDKWLQNAKAKQLQRSDEEQALLLPQPKKQTQVPLLPGASDDDEGGRIIHWTRERRPWRE